MILGNITPTLWVGQYDLWCRVDVQHVPFFRHALPVHTLYLSTECPRHIYRVLSAAFSLPLPLYRLSAIASLHLDMPNPEVTAYRLGKSGLLLYVLWSRPHQHLVLTLLAPI